MRFAVVITSNDGGSGHVCEGLEAVVELLEYQFVVEPENEDADYYLAEDKERLAEEVAKLRTDLHRHGYIMGYWSVRGRDRWKETAYIGVIADSEQP